MSARLLPCPFCGVQAAVFCETSVWWVRCENCQAESGSSDTDEGATEIWNTRSKPVAGVEVKPLEWSKTSYGQPEVETAVGVYRVFEHVDGGWAATFKTFNLVDAHGRKNFATEDEALAAAEADYRNRILSTLLPKATAPVVSGPVAAVIRLALQAADATLTAEAENRGDVDEDYEANVGPALSKVRNALAIVDASPQPEAVITEARILYRHQKRGTVYELIGIGKMQAEAWRDPGLKDGTVYGPSVDMREVAVYRSADNPDEIWVRPREEFQDGRFDKVDSSNG